MIHTVLARSAAAQPATHRGAIVEYLRAMVVGAPGRRERFHAVFLDDDQAFLGDAPLGLGSPSALSLRMRDLFSRALAMGAAGIIIAHNHPSGDCRPSREDIEATHRLADIARALDILVLDHLIFTQDAIYSMRAGGQL